MSFSKKTNKVKVLLYEDNRDLREGIAYLLQATPGLELVGAFPTSTTSKANSTLTCPTWCCSTSICQACRDWKPCRLSSPCIPAHRSSCRRCSTTTSVFFRRFAAARRVFAQKHPAGGDRAGRVRRASRRLAHDVERGAQSASVFPATAQNPPHRPSALRPRTGYFERPDERSYKLIANELHISIDTVRTHIRNVYDKLQVNSKTEAILKAMKEGWVSDK